MLGWSVTPAQVAESSSVKLESHIRVSIYIISRDIDEVSIQSRLDNNSTLPHLVKHSNSTRLISGPPFAGTSSRSMED